MGDLFDGWVGRREAKWTEECTAVIRVLLTKANEGSTIYYTPGNHDAIMRRMNGSELGNVQVEHAFVHRLLDGRDLWVEHGDLFDRSCTTYRPIALAGAWMYEFAIYLNKGVNAVRTNRHRRPIDFSGALKRAIKGIARRKGGFASKLIEHAASNGCQAVLCGHIHRPEIKEPENGVQYMNCGDWVEHRTAIVEDLDGAVKLIEWTDLASERVESEAPMTVAGLGALPT